MDWERIIYALPGIILGLTVHEYSHAYLAFRLGDNTARDQGRLTLNPVRHIDIIGLLFIIFAGFGWAKPVQFNPENLRNVRRDKAIIAAAGPLSNLILGLILAFFLRMLIFHHAENELTYTVITERLVHFLFFAASINFGLFIFNLLPIPPLDGSHIVFSGLNLSQETEYRIMKFGAPALFIILIVQSQIGITILPIRSLVDAILGLIMPF
jgi:Zn-dependent protease